METGRVYKSTGSWYQVKINDEIWECRIKGRLRLKGLKSTNPVAVGDLVYVEKESTEQKQGLIKDIADRRNYIIRKSVNLSRRTHIIAANLDQAIIIATLKNPVTHARFIDRFLVTAEAYDIPAAVVFNKIDLYDQQLMEDLEYFTMAYRDAGYEVLHTSVESATGLEGLKEYLEDKTSLLSGYSGVGKSSLINAIEPGLDLKTAGISQAHLQGQHTTTFAEMFDLSFGGAIIDTPGIRGFGLVDMEKEEIGDYFPEIFREKDKCKFHNCLHLEEPGCAVIDAVEQSRIALFRYESYLALLKGEDDETYRTDIYT